MGSCLEKLGGFDEGFYSNTSRVVLLTRLGYVQGLHSLNLVSSCFLAVPPLISNCSSPPFGTQGRSWRLESFLQEMGDKKASVPESPTGPHSVSQGETLKLIATRVLGLPQSIEID